MINKKVSEITLTDLQTLINNGVQEGKTIDFKEKYNLDNDKEKGEFLADVSSFANATGGDLIFGIQEEKGVAEIIKGFELENIDTEKQKIENLVRMGIVPRLNIDIRVVQSGENKHLLIIRIPKSWIGPHRVTFTAYSKTKDQFYSRNSAGKYPLDVTELRTAFTLSDTLSEKIQNFKTQRIAKIVADDTPIPLHEGGKIILHIIPTDAFSPNKNLDIKELAKNPAKLRPMYARGWNDRVNIEGFLTFSGGREERSHSYTQLYRNGILESVEAAILMDERYEGREDGKKIIPSLTYEEEIIKSLKEYLSLLQEIGVVPPFFIFLTITGAKGFEMGVDRVRFWDDYYKIDRDVLNLPEMFIENFGDTAENILKPVFDLVWNACGYQRSYNFDENGIWIGNERR